MKPSVSASNLSTSSRISLHLSLSADEVLHKVVSADGHPQAYKTLIRKDMKDEAVAKGVECLVGGNVSVCSSVCCLCGDSLDQDVSFEHVEVKKRVIVKHIFESGKHMQPYTK